MSLTYQFNEFEVKYYTPCVIFEVEWDILLNKMCRIDFQSNDNWT